jgi:hypothetical protein
MEAAKGSGVHASLGGVGGNENRLCGGGGARPHGGDG